MNYVKNITEEQLVEIYKRLPLDTRLIWRIGYETGLRISDILRLKVSQLANPIEIYESRLKCFRRCGLSDGLYNALVAHTANRDGLEYIFPSKRAGKHLHRATYHRQLKQTGFECSAHCTRRWFLAP